MLQDSFYSTLTSDDGEHICKKSRGTSSTLLPNCEECSEIKRVNLLCLCQGIACLHSQENASAKAKASDPPSQDG